MKRSSERKCRSETGTDGLIYLLDTNIAIHAGDRHAQVLDRLIEYDGSIFLSALCLAELQRGLHKTPALTAPRRVRLDMILTQIPVLSFDTAAAEAYGAIIAQCGWVKGRDFDRMIAAHAISAGAKLVTANEADFRDIPGLELVNWVID